MFLRFVYDKNGKLYCEVCITLAILYVYKVKCVPYVNLTMTLFTLFFFVFRSLFVWLILKIYALYVCGIHAHIMESAYTISKHIYNTFIVFRKI